MKTSSDIIKILSKHKKEIMERYKLQKIGIFGSYARGEASEKSDVDILVEFKEGHKTFDNYMDLKFFLENLLATQVDLLIESAIKPRLKPYILEEVIYV